MRFAGRQRLVCEPLAPDRLVARVLTCLVIALLATVAWHWYLQELQVAGRPACVLPEDPPASDPSPARSSRLGCVRDESLSCILDAPQRSHGTSTPLLRLRCHPRRAIDWPEDLAQGFTIHHEHAELCYRAGSPGSGVAVFLGEPCGHGQSELQILCTTTTTATTVEVVYMSLCSLGNPFQELV